MVSVAIVGVARSKCGPGRHGHSKCGPSTCGGARLGEEVLDLAELEQLDLQAELVQRRAVHLGQLVRREAGAPG